MINFPKRKEQYIRYFMEYADCVIEKRNSSDISSVDEALSNTRELIETASTIGNAVTASFTLLCLASAVAAPVSGGASLAVPLVVLTFGSGVIAAAQASRAGIKLINASLQHGGINESSDDNLKSRDNQIALKILCREIAEEIITVQYRYFFEKNNLTEEGIRVSARYGAARTIKIIFSLVPEEKEKRWNKIKSWRELLPSARRILHEISLSAKDAKERFDKEGSIYYAKWIYTRPRAIYVELEGEGERKQARYDFYSTQNGLFGERLISPNSYSTLIQYGYMMLRNIEECDLCLMSELSSGKPKPDKLYLMIENNQIKYRTHLTPGNDLIALEGNIAREGGELYQAINQGRLTEIKPLCKKTLLDQTTKHGHTHIGLKTGVSSSYIAMRVASAMSIPADFEDIKDHFVLNYEVKRQEVEKYLQTLNERAPANTNQSLNQYLKNLFGEQSVIANCHGDQLKGLPLSGGNFSGVNFRRAILMNCLLQNTFWDDAHLDYAELGQEAEGFLSLSEADFGRCTAEKSIWKRIDFRRSRFNSAKMMGVCVESFIFKDDDFDRGAEWYFADLHDARLFIEGVISSEVISLRDGDQIPLESGGSRPQLRDIFGTLRARVARLEVRVDQVENDIISLNSQAETPYTGIVITAIAVTSDNIYYAMGRNDGFIDCRHCENSDKYILIRHQHSISSLAWSKNNRYLVSGDWGGATYVWDNQRFVNGNNAHKRELVGHRMQLTCIAWSFAFEDYVATGSDDGTVRIWNTANFPENISPQKIVIGTIILAIAWSSQSKMLAVASKDHKIYFCDAPLDGIGQTWSIKKVFHHYPTAAAFAWSSTATALAWSWWYDLCLLSDIGQDGPKPGRLYLAIENGGCVKYRTNYTPGSDLVALDGNISQNDGELCTAIIERDLARLSLACKTAVLDETSKRGHTPRKNYIASADKQGVRISDEQGKYVRYFSAPGDKDIRWNKDKENELICIASQKSETKVYIWSINNGAMSSTYLNSNLPCEKKLCHSSGALYFSIKATFFQGVLGGGANEITQHDRFKTGVTNNGATSTEVLNPFHT